MQNSEIFFGEWENKPNAVGVKIYQKLDAP